MRGKDELLTVSLHDWYTYFQPLTSEELKRPLVFKKVPWAGAWFRVEKWAVDLLRAFPSRNATEWLHVAECVLAAPCGVEEAVRLVLATCLLVNAPPPDSPATTQTRWRDAVRTVMEVAEGLLAPDHFAEDEG
jgi:hypothetical protein